MMALICLLHNQELSQIVLYQSWFRSFESHTGQPSLSIRARPFRHPAGKTGHISSLQEQTGHPLSLNTIHDLGQFDTGLGQFDCCLLVTPLSSFAFNWFTFSMDQFFGMMILPWMY